MRKALPVALLLLLQTNVARLQETADLAWSRHLDAGGEDHVFDLVLSESGDVISTGTGGAVTETEGSGIITMRTSKHGDVLWINRIDVSPGSNELGTCISQGVDGFSYLAGQSYTYDGPVVMVVASVDAAGSTRWIRQYSGPVSGEAAARALAIDNQGNVIVAGCVWDADDYDVVVLKYTPSGDLIWEYIHEPESTDDLCAWSVSVSTADEIVVTCNSALLKLMPDGVLAWERPAGSYSAVISSLGQITVANMLWDFSRQDYDAHVLRFSGQGDTVWETTIDGPGHNFDLPSVLCSDLDGGVVLGGETRDTILGQGAILWHIDTAGVLTQTSRLPGGGVVACVGTGGNDVLALTEGCLTPGECGRILMRVDQTGNLDWSIVDQAPWEPFSGYPPARLLVDSEGGVYTAGSYDVGQFSLYWDFGVAKFAICNAAPPSPPPPVTSDSAPCPSEPYAISWAHVDGPYALYDIFENGQLVRTVTELFADFAHPSGTYHYQIAARNSCGTSLQGPVSNAVTVTGTQQGQQPIVSNPSPCFDEVFTVSWPAQPAALSYRLFANGYAVYEGLDTSVTRAEFSGTFTFTVAIVDECGVGLESSATSVTIADCYCHGDPECDGEVFDLLDVVKTINIAFAGSPDFKMVTCPRGNADFNCDGNTDIRDVVTAIDVAFRGADPALRFCDPCNQP